MNHSTAAARSLDRFLAIIGAIACLIISVRIWQVLSPGQPMWPLPDVYLIEVTAASLVGMLSLVAGDTWPPRLRVLSLWSVVGVFFGFAILGAWSIGLMYLPIALIFASAAIASDRRRGQKSAGHVAIALIAAIIQIAVMLIIIQIIYPLP